MRWFRIVWHSNVPVTCRYLFELLAVSLVISGLAENRRGLRRKLHLPGLSCSMASENTFRIFHVVFMMLQLEFLWSGIVHRYSNFGKLLHPLGVFLSSVICGTDGYIRPSSFPPSYGNRFASSWFTSLRVFSLRHLQREVNRKMVPRIFWCGQNIINSVILSFHSWGTSGPERVSSN